MPIRTGIIESTLFYRLNVAPAPLLDLAGALSYQTMAAAAELGVFQVLQEGPLTASEAAQKIEAAETGTRALLNALAAIGYLDENQGRYSNSRSTEKWLLSNDLFDLKAATAYWNAIMENLWPHSSDIIRSGRRPFSFYEWIADDPELLEAFQRMNATSAILTGPDIVKKLDLPSSAEKILDVGGRHGMFSIIFCQEDPNLLATVLDSAPALSTAKKNIEKHNLNAQVRLYPGDMWQVDWGQDYDAVFLFNLLHHFDLEINKILLQKAADALRPGGQLAILEQLEGSVRGAAANAFVQLVALLYHLAVDGRVFSQDELISLLDQTGFANIRIHGLARSPGSSLVTAKKP